MIINASLEDVLARPYPSLDQSADADKRFQFGAYQDALTLLLDPNQTVIHSVPAGAGSGKTRLLVAILNGLLRYGVPYDQIEAISFTNASSNDFRRKHIEALVNGGTEFSLSPENICFSTIHQCAMNVLKKLQPHMGGVAYYFEDAPTGAQDDEDEERRRAVRLALYSSVVYGEGDEALLDTLAGYAEQNEKTFILDDLGTGNHFEKAQKLIKEELASDAGLGAFTNMAEGGPDFCIAVATDALMRLYKAKIPLEIKRSIYGIPAYMAVDEAQDLDFLQLLFIRALAQNGTSIILVGDSRQTLYEFRQSLSDYPFLQKFMDDFVKGTTIKASISEHALRTNYRCRKEIIDAAEDISDLAVEYSEERWNQEPRPSNLRLIEDPEHIAKGLPNINASNQQEKCSAAITVIIGEPADPIHQSADEPTAGPGGALRLLPEFKAVDKLTKSKTKKPKLSQIMALSGGHEEHRIHAHLIKLYERALGGETAGIITRNGIRDTDKRHIESIIQKAYPDAKQKLKLNIISPPKHTPLAEYWFPDHSGQSKHELPFSSVMIAGALTFIFSSDRETLQRLRTAGKRELNYVFVTPDGIRMGDQSYEDYVQIIAEELKLFFGGLKTKLTDLFPDADPSTLMTKFDELRPIVARFTFDVIVQYGRLLWQTRQLPESHPCRFHHIASKYMEGRYEAMGIRPLSETKGYFKMMWRALASTRFALTEKDRLLLRDVGLTPEVMDADTSLSSFTQSINDYCCVHGIRKPNLDSMREIFIKDRETIYDEFSQLWHIKTRTYMREIARCLGKEVRANPNSTEEAYRFVVWREAYQNARFKSRVNMTYKPDKNQYGGLFLDLINGIKHDAVIQRRNGKSKHSDGQVVIDITTIHSSKGLEWDHVMLYFPQPSPKDKDSSFKSCRDLIYVAITRAAQTLTIVLKKRTKWVESPTDTGIKVFVELMHRWAEKNDYYNRELNWGEVVNHHDSLQNVVIFDETSHSELERSQTCRMHHYFQDMRHVSTMVPLTPPSYAFFFHSTMSAICAAFINQRLPSRVDPSIEIASAVAQIVDRKLDEDAASRFLISQVHDNLYTLMESMIPMYFLGDRGRHHDVLTFYTDALAHQLAAITAKSQLFVILKAYRSKPAYRILIEKSVRKVLPASDMGSEFLPIVGIPDIKIIGPDLTYVADYKTLPKYDDSQGDEELEIYEQMLSTKTQQQVNYYQGMVQANIGHRYLAELLYVADITLMEYEEIPKICAALPHINQGPNYKVVAGVNHAQVLYTDHFDRDQFDDTVIQIQDLRKEYTDNTVRPEHMFQPVPLVGGGLGEVTTDQCRQCGSSVHCAFSKHLHLVEA